MWIGTIEQSDSKVSKEQYCEKLYHFQKTLSFQLFLKAESCPYNSQQQKTHSENLIYIWALQETTTIKHSSSCVCQGTLLLILLTLKNISCGFPIRNYLLREREWGRIGFFSSLSTKKLINYFQWIVTWKTGLVMVIYFWNRYVKQYFVIRTFGICVAHCHY